MNQMFRMGNEYVAALGQMGVQAKNLEPSVERAFKLGMFMWAWPMLLGMAAMSAFIRK